MDTVSQVPAIYIENIESVEPADLTEEELSMVLDYVLLTQDAIEAKQLFDVFYFNLISLRNNFVFYIDDRVERLGNCPDCVNESIAVNAHIINLLGSAKTLVERLRIPNEGEFSLFVKNNYYDKSQNYRLMMALRDFSQHGHLPVSFKENRYSFDASQIIDAPHFSLNKQVKKDMADFLDKFDLSKEIPCYSLTYTVADFVVMITDIYKSFLTHIKPKVRESYKNIQAMISKKPDIICNNPTLNGHIIYEVNKKYHSFIPKENPNQMIKEYYKSAEAIYKDEKQALDDIKLYLKRTDMQ